MANGRSFDSAINIIKLNPELDVGVHLSLTQGKPILNFDKVDSLSTKEGYFHNHVIDFSKRYFSSSIALPQVKNEFAAQIEKILDHGIKITHIDSHQHVHILPKILNIVSELAELHKIKYIRFPMEGFKPYMVKKQDSVYRIVQLMALNYFCSKAKGKINLRTDYFSGFYFGGRLNQENLITLINHLPSAGTIELMCHPGFMNNSEDFSESNYRQVEEMYALTNKHVTEILLKKNIEISSFRNLLSRFR
jgi:predicted glycoside hydrolase/deacetylase ChbG (UPF0249 family)